MLAASRSGAHEPPRLRKHSVASLGSSRAQRNAQENNRDNRSNSIAQQRARKVMLIRELETSWYLKTCGLSREDTTAHQTGMPYRRVKFDLAGSPGLSVPGGAGILTCVAADRQGQIHPQPHPSLSHHTVWCPLAIRSVEDLGPAHDSI
ncbi:hypothetical protein ANANG_G00235020 [Anguilla anguilla]|uniref:Uncharacterized protein n=1 Tax=Anguilla anguilla TaxID=7936 RepID=A0A9D3M208_ANGAN|nr:hypothetical protein ANANG_G00235020 [Anguilla anguilla]